MPKTQNFINGQARVLLCRGAATPTPERVTQKPAHKNPPKITPEKRAFKVGLVAGRYKVSGSLLQTPRFQF